MANNKVKASKHESGRYDFLKLAPIMGGISALCLIVAVVAIAVKGFNYGIDFSGGTEIQVQFQNAISAEDLRNLFRDSGYPGVSVQAYGGANEYLVRVGEISGKDEKETQDLTNVMVKKMTLELTEKFSSSKPEIRRVDSVGPAVGDQLKRNSILAVFYSLIMILIYVGLRFEYKSGIAAVACLFHDAIVTVGIFALIGKEVNVQTLAAVLTLIGYSLNDTIINFDRMRENAGIFRDEDLKFIINRSVNDMLSRTILTTFATFLAVVSLWLFGGEVIENLAFTLMIGLVFGVYSTIYVAAPLVYVMTKLEGRKTALKQVTRSA